MQKNFSFSGAAVRVRLPSALHQELEQLLCQHYSEGFQRVPGQAQGSQGHSEGGS